MSVLYTPVTCPSCLSNNQVEYFSDLNVERCNQCGASFTFIDGEKLFFAAEAAREAAEAILDRKIANCPVCSQEDN